MKDTAVQDMTTQLAYLKQSQPEVETSPSTEPLHTGRAKRSALNLPWIKLKWIGPLVLLTGGIASGFFLGKRQEQTSLLSVNGVPISQRDFWHRCELAAGPQVAQQMLHEELQLQFAGKQGVLPNQAEVEARYREAQKLPEFQKNLVITHQTPADVKHSLLVDMAQKAVLGKGIAVTESDIQNFYQHNIDKNNPTARYYQPETVSLAVVICDQEAGLKSAQHDLASGASFESVVAKYSKDNSRANKGLLPPLRRGQTDAHKYAGLEQTLFGLQPGHQIDSLKIGAKWWLIRCVGKTTESTVPFAQVAEECRTGALLTKGLQANGVPSENAFAEFQKTAQIQSPYEVK
jgi:hypothetical protein